MNAVFTALTPVAGIIAAEVDVGSVSVEHDGRATVDALRRGDRRGRLRGRARGGGATAPARRVTRGGGLWQHGPTSYFDGLARSIAAEDVA